MENGFPKINFSDSINSSSIKSFIHTLEDLCAQHPEAKLLIFLLQEVMSMWQLKCSIFCAI